MNLKGIFLLVLAVVALTACATIPAGPSVTVWPGPGKPFEVFQSDDAVCRQWASQRARPEPFGYEWALQRRYDNAYMQCMYARGNQVPGGPLRQAVPPPSGVYPPPPTGEPGIGNISPPPPPSEIKPNPN